MNPVDNFCLQESNLIVKFGLLIVGVGFSPESSLFVWFHSSCIFR